MGIILNFDDLFEAGWFLRLDDIVWLFLKFRWVFVGVRVKWLFAYLILKVLEDATEGTIELVEVSKQRGKGFFLLKRLLVELEVGIAVHFWNYY